jgi:hypothetical protein
MPPHTDEAAYSGVVPVYAALGGTGCGKRPAWAWRYFASLLNLAVDQR